MLWVHKRDYQSLISTDMHMGEDTGYQLLVLRRNRRINLWVVNYITTYRNNHFIQSSEVLPVVCNSAKRNAMVARNEHDEMR